MSAGTVDPRTGNVLIQVTTSCIVVAGGGQNTCNYDDSPSCCWV